jgi:hypothetical protein
MAEMSGVPQTTFHVGDPLSALAGPCWSAQLPVTVDGFDVARMAPAATTVPVLVISCRSPELFPRDVGFLSAGRPHRPTVRRRPALLRLAGNTWLTDDRMSRRPQCRRRAGIRPGGLRLRAPEPADGADRPHTRFESNPMHRQGTGPCACPLFAVQGQNS